MRFLNLKVNILQETVIQLEQLESTRHLPIVFSLDRELHTIFFCGRLVNVYSNNFPMIGHPLFEDVFAG
jgi:hypothetical protein